MERDTFTLEMFETPVLFIIFNRPDTTRQTFEVIQRLKPRYLFIAADGPRPNSQSDTSRCAETRAIVQQIDWPCDLHIRFLSENRGCGRGPSEAITWFFEHVEQGIVLEDDCLADDTFFPYCEDLLVKYQRDERVYMITGTNAMNTWRFGADTYFFSYMANSLGWASWRRAWKNFDYTLQAWSTSDGQDRIRQTLANPSYFAHFSQVFSTYQATQPIDVWDFQWLFARWVNGGRTITPAVNLVRNLGFHADATHSFNENDPLAKLPLHQMRFPLRAAGDEVENLFDWCLFERFVNPAQRPLWKKVVLKMLKLSIRPS